MLISILIQKLKRKTQNFGVPPLAGQAINL